MPLGARSALMGFKRGLARVGHHLRTPGDVFPIRARIGVSSLRSYSGCPEVFRIRRFTGGFNVSVLIVNTKPPRGAGPLDPARADRDCVEDVGFADAPQRARGLFLSLANRLSGRFERAMIDKMDYRALALVGHWLWLGIGPRGQGRLTF